MTTEHPITPTPELVHQWVEEAATAPVTEQLTTPRYIATQAARWGADMELEACINAILVHPGFENPELFVELLRAARRPKPPSLKERGREALHNILAAVTINPGGRELDVLKEIVESLPD